MLSAREVQAARERRQWIDAENMRVREQEDRAEYATYVQQMQQERLNPLSFEEWRIFIPQEFQDKPPAVRGGLASATSTWNQTVGTMRDMVANQPLPDDLLADLGFDIRERFANVAMEVNELGIRAVFEKWIPTEPRFDKSLHIDKLADFLTRNRLFPTLDHIARAFQLLWNMAIFPPKPEPEPAPARPDGLNEYGVNLQIEPDPAIEARKREKYETEVVVIDPETGRGWTAYQLEHQADAEKYRRLMKIPRLFKNPALEPRH